MKWIITYIVLLFATFALAQYPEVDEFTSIGGAGEWFNQSGQANMGVEGSVQLCYNIATS